MLDAIKKEITYRKDELHDRNLKSLYFGGGTPSVLSADEIKYLIDEVLKYHNFDSEIEITLEANPDDLTGNFIKELSKSSINRLSIGTQSFFDQDLKLMNRAHNSSEAEASIKRAQDGGFENLSIDLIYGAPTSDFETWKHNLKKTVELQVPHVSSYALTIEPKTALNSWIKKNKTLAPNESEQNREFYYMSEFLQEQGFEHYEISNFSKPGFHSKHNSAYWSYEPYLGIGPSAHSYDGLHKRSWNIANNSLYVKKIANQKLPHEVEILSDKDRFNEMMMIGLRTLKGVDLNRLNENFSQQIIEHYTKETSSKFESGLLTIENNHLKIPEKHWFMADGIASDLFIL